MNFSESIIYKYTVTCHICSHVYIDLQQATRSIILFYLVDDLLSYKCELVLYTIVNCDNNSTIVY